MLVNGLANPLPQSDGAASHRFQIYQLPSALSAAARLRALALRALLSEYASDRGAYHPFWR